MRAVNDEEMAVNKAPTIRDVAREAGVSVAVVSRVLNDGTGAVAQATRAKVVDVIARLDYRPSAAAKELKQARSSTIGLVLADLANPFFARLADRVVWEVRARGVQVVLMTTQEDPHLEADSLATLLDRSVGGIIATPTGGNSSKWNRLRERGVDVVFVDRTMPDFPNADLVSIENARSARIATTHLVDLGHERIGFISGPLTTSTGRSRTEGYTQTLAERGIDFDPRLIHATAFRGEGGADAVGALLALEQPPSALIVANTAQVPVVLKRLAQGRIAIPEELSVIVFDDNPWTELVTPPLTVIRQPIDLLAVHSVELLLGRMNGRLSNEPRSIFVDADFVQRGSTAPPRHPRAISSSKAGS